MKKFRYFILALVCCMLVSAPIRTMAATQYGEVYEWTGDIATVQPTGLLHLDYTYQENQSYDGSDIVNGYVISSYSGDAVMYMDLQGNDLGYINGIIQFPVTFAINDSVGTEYYFNAVLEHSYIDGIVTHSAITKSSVNSVTVRVFVEFNDYFVEGSDRIPLHFSLSYSNRVNSQRNNVIGYKSTNPVRDEWAGSLTFYSDIRDTPGYDGRMAMYASQSATRLQTINGTIKTMHEDLVQKISFFRNEVASYFADLTNNISNSFTSLTSNLSKWYNGMTSTLTDFFTPYFDNITESFKKALSDTQATDNKVLSGAMDDYQSAEQEVFAPAMDSLTDFDFGSNDISSLGTGFIGAITFVSSCLSNMYDLTPFSAVFDVIATLALASICIGMSRLWFGKKGR